MYYSPVRAGSHGETNHKSFFVDYQCSSQHRVYLSSKGVSLTLTRFVFPLEQSHDADDQPHEAKHDTGNDLGAHSELDYCTKVVSPNGIRLQGPCCYNRE